MYKYSHSGFKNMVSEYETYETDLKRIKADIETERSEAKNCWEGEASTAFDLGIVNFLGDGDFHSLELHVSGVKGIMEWGEGQVSALKFQSERIGTALGSPVMNPTDIVTLDTSSFSSFRSGLDSIYTTNDNIETTLNGVVSAGSGIVDLSAESGLIAAAHAKVEKLKNFDSNLCAYKTAVLNFDSSFDADLASYTDDTVVGGTDDSDVSKEYLDLLARLDENGMTMEEYYSAIFDAAMYIDVFDVHYEEGVVKYNPSEHQDLLNDIKKGDMTFSEYINRLKRIKDIYRGAYKDSIDLAAAAIEADPALGEYVIVSCSRAEGYNEGTNAFIFKDPDPNVSTYYVAWRGTSGPEWVDDAERFGVKSADYEDYTKQMQEVYDYFNDFMKDKTEADTIYVTGHSQGGNDAQLCILLSPYGNLVDACYSMDGEGHSPELLQSLREKWGEEEFNARVSRMFAINGYDDPVHELGEKVILDENTIQIYCELAPDATYAHDIRGMFCDEDGNLSYIIHETMTGVSPLARLGANLWKELNTLPPGQRAGCAVALLSILQIFMEKDKINFDDGFSFEEFVQLLGFTRTIDGSGPSAGDYFSLLNSGLDVILDAIGLTALEELRKYIYEMTGDDVLDAKIQVFIGLYEFYGSLDNIPKSIISAIGSGAIDICKENIQEIIDICTIIYNGVPDIWGDICKGGREFWDIFSEYAKEDFLNSLVHFIKRDYLAFAVDKFRIWTKYVPRMGKVFWNTFSDVFEDGVGIVIDVVKRQIDGLKNKLDIVCNKGKDFVQGIYYTVGNAGRKLYGFGQDLFNYGKVWLEDKVETVVEIKDAVVEWGSDRVDDIKEFGEEAIDWAGDRVDDAIDWAGDRLDDLKDFGEDVVDWTGDRVDDAIDWAGDRLDDLEDFGEAVWDFIF